MIRAVLVFLLFFSSVVNCFSDYDPLPDDDYQLLCVLPNAACRCSTCKENMQYQDLKTCTIVTDYSSYSNYYYVNLSRCGLKSLPNNLSSTLKRLDVSYNSIEEISADTAFRLFPLGSDVVFRYNPIKRVGFNGSYISSLSRLDLSFLQLTQVPSMIKGASLSSLMLWSNHLTVFEDLDLKGLTYLDLEENSLTSHPDVSGYPSLRVLYLAYNSITSIPAKLGSLYSLQRYSIHHNRLREIGSYALSELFSSYSSSVLDLSYNSLTTLPADFGDFTYLSSLDLSHNKFASFPYSLLDIYSLSYLRMDYNEMTTIPNMVKDMRSLDYVFLSHNSLTSIPSALLSLSGIYLDASYNKIKSQTFPYVSYYYYSSSPYRIDLSHNRLTDLKDIEYFKASYLDISYNNLTELGDMRGIASGLYMQFNSIKSIQRLSSSLKWIDVYNNKLKNLDALSSMSYLYRLDASYNSIRSISSTIVNGAYLSSLDLSHNKLSMMPSVSYSTGLNYLNLEYNSLKSFSISTSLGTQIHTLLLQENLLSDLPLLEDFYRTNISINGNCFTCSDIQDKLPDWHTSNWTCDDDTMNHKKCIYYIPTPVSSGLSTFSIIFVVVVGFLFYFAFIGLSRL